MEDAKGLQSHQQKRDAIPAGTPVQGWEYDGCYSDTDITDDSIKFGFFWTPASPALLSIPQKMSAALCTSSCSLNRLGGHFKYAGLRGDTCFCFNQTPNDKASDDTCGNYCWSDDIEACGETAYGPGALTVYVKPEDRPVEPNTDVVEWEYAGCYSLEANAYVLLADGLAIGYSVTVDNDIVLCTTQCRDRGTWMYVGMLDNGCFYSNNAPIVGSSFPEVYLRDSGVPNER